jgi:hypothetical protein
MEEDAHEELNTEPLLSNTVSNEEIGVLYVVNDPLSTIGIKSSVVGIDNEFNWLILTFDIF